MNFVLLVGGHSDEDIAVLQGQLIDTFGAGETLRCTVTTVEDLRAEFQSAVDRATLDSAPLLLPATPRFLRLESLSGSAPGYLMWCEDPEHGTRATLKAPGTWSDALTAVAADLADGFAPPHPTAIWLDRAGSSEEEAALDRCLDGEEGPDWQVVWGA
jgi:hypothetical protein